MYEQAGGENLQGLVHRGRNRGVYTQEHGEGRVCVGR